MQIHRPIEFRADRAWGARDIERIETATVRLHWTDEAYVWHVNDGPEVFVVLDGEVDMFSRSEGSVSVVRLKAGDVANMREGDEHRAVPVGEARILVIEREGSI